MYISVSLLLFIVTRQTLFNHDFMTLHVKSIRTDYFSPWITNSNPRLLVLCAPRTRVYYTLRLRDSIRCAIYKIIFIIQYVAKQVFTYVLM